MKQEPNAERAGTETEGPSSLPRTPALALLWRIKTTCFSTFAFGYFQATAVLNVPIFLMVSRGIAKEDTILLPAYFAAGMLLFSNFIGRFADRVGHLFVMRLLGAIGTVMVSMFAFVHSWPILCVAIFVAGATLASLSPVALALQGHMAERHEYARANGIYNTFYAVGMLVGPPMSSFIYARFEPSILIWHLVGLWSAFVAFTIVFFRDDPRARRTSSAELSKA